MPEAPYQRALRALRARIADGTWPPGTQLPSRHQLARELHLGTGAVQHAIAILRARGELAGEQRRRPWVAHPVPVHTLTRPAHDPPGQPVVHDRDRVTATAGLAERIAVPAGARVQRERTEYLDARGMPSHLTTVWWTGRRASTWARAVWRLRQHALTADEAAVLGLVQGVAAWLLERTRYDEDGRPVETADVVLPADRWQLAGEG